MTPAVEAAKKAGIQFKIHEYPHDAQSSSHTIGYGEEASALLGISPLQVFKTLVISTNSKQLAIAIIPVSHQLNLKSAAKALNAKKATMADPHDAEKATGYILGGISPLGQKKRLRFVIDNSSSNFKTIYISGGRQGLEIELSPQDLAQLCSAKIFDIKNK